MIYRTAILATVVVLGLLVRTQEVTADYDRNYKIYQIHTFATKIGTSWGDPPSEQRTREAVSKAVVQRGWQLTDENAADVLVVIHGATQARKSLNSFYSGGGYAEYGWRGWDGGNAKSSESEYSVGTLVVDIFDVKEKKLVFRGVGHDEISENPGKNEKKLQEGVAKMFKRFPPQPG